MNKLFLIKIVLIAILLINAASLVKSQEIQMPFCEKYQTITPDLASKISTFKEVAGFKEAYLFLQTDSTYTLEIYYIKNGSTIRDRKVLTKAQIESICSEINQIVPQKNTDELDFGKAGKRRLIASSMVFSLGYYGWALPAAFNSENEKVYVTSYLFIGSAGFFVPFLSTRRKEVTMGMAKGYTTGSLLGIGHGWLLTLLLQGESINQQVGLGTSIVTSITEGIAGYAIAKKYNYSYATMNMIGSGGTWGAAYGIGLPYVFNSENARLYGFSTLLLSGAGMYGGSYFASKIPISTGDVRVMNTLGVLGGYLSLSFMNSVTDEVNKATVSLMMASSLAGLGFGLYKAKNEDYDRQSGNIIFLGTVAGGLTGAGIAYLANSEPNGYLIMSSLGATAGFFAIDALVRKDIKKNPNNQKASLDFEVNPFPFYGLLNGDAATKPYANNTLDYNYMVKMRLRF